MNYERNENSIHDIAAAARPRFFGYVVFLSISILVAAIGYLTDAANPFLLMAVGLLSLYVAYRLLNRYLALSADFVTIDQTVRAPSVTIAIAYEIPPELDRVTIKTRIFNAAQEALDHHISEKGSTKRDDLKAVIYDAVHKIILVECNAVAFNIRIPSIEPKKADEPQQQPPSIIIGHGRR